MNTSLITINPKRVLQLVSSASVMIALTLATSGLMAQSPTPTPREGKCERWFKSLTNEQKDDIADAVTKALTDSAAANGTALRATLLDTRNCYKAPKDKMQEILDTLIRQRPGHKSVKFPTDALFVFYQPELPSPTAVPQPPSPAPIQTLGTQPYHNEHCLHIFYLPEVGQAAVLPANFTDNIQCCYQPWKPSTASTPTPPSAPTASSTPH